MLVDHVVGQGSKVLALSVLIEKLELSEADETGGHPADHGRGFHRFPVHRFRRRHQAQAARGGDAEGVHRFRAEIFPYRRTQHRATIQSARIRRRSRALELEFHARPGGRSNLRDHEGASVAELRNPNPELMPGINRCQRLIFRPGPVAGENLQELRGISFADVEPQFQRQRR